MRDHGCFCPNCSSSIDRNSDFRLDFCQVTVKLLLKTSVWTQLIALLVQHNSYCTKQSSIIHNQELCLLTNNTNTHFNIHTAQVYLCDEMCLNFLSLLLALTWPLSSNSSTPTPRKGFVVFMSSLVHLPIHLSHGLTKMSNFSQISDCFCTTDNANFSLTSSTDASCSQNCCYCYSCSLCFKVL